MPMRDTPPPPLLTVPQVAFPPQRVSHGDVMQTVRDQYLPACRRRADDPDYREQFVKEVERGLMMAARLGIDSHPLHLGIAELTRPRGLEQRNAQALEAFRRYVPQAARRALEQAGVCAADVDAVLVETSTSLAMPAPAAEVIGMLGLRSGTEIIPLWGMGCNGGAHAVSRGRDYVLAHPGHVLLVIAADFASPWFFPEEGLRGAELRGSVISSALFADAAAAAVMAARLDPGVPGFRIVETASVCVPGTQGALAWKIMDDGLHFRLTGAAMDQVPYVAKELNALLDAQGMTAADLSVCSLHTGGDGIIRKVAEALGLTPHQVRPTREALKSGNTMSVAVFDAMRIIAASDELRPAHGGRGLGAGFGPGFASTGFIWEWQGAGPAARPASGTVRMTLSAQRVPEDGEPARPRASAARPVRAVTPRDRAAHAATTGHACEEDTGAA